MKADGAQAGTSVARDTLTLSRGASGQNTKGKQPSIGTSPSMKMRQSVLPILLILASLVVAPSADERRFERITSFSVAQNAPQVERTASEIVAATPDGKTVVYADSLGGGIGFLDTSNPEHPVGKGWMRLSGEPTAVGIHQDWALVVVADDSGGGYLQVIEIKTHHTVARLNLGGQPDSISLSKDGRFAAIVLENEAVMGEFPEAPPGALVVFKLLGEPKSWTSYTVDFQGLPMEHPEDPEPEYVSIGPNNIAAVTFQENNHLALVDLEKEAIVGDFSCGSAPLVNVDLTDDGRVSFTESAPPLPREPDSVDWCSLGIVTADEGDYKGGTRTFTIFSPKGEVLFSSGSELEEIARDYGQYPDNRSDKRGTEPESLKVVKYGQEEFILVGCERSNLVAVYQVLNGKPVFRQALSDGPGPETVAAVPEHNLLIVGTEVDFPDKGVRSYLSIYRYGPPTLPNSMISSGGIPWTALSALSADGSTPGYLFTAPDKALKPPTLLRLDTRRTPFLITDSWDLSDFGRLDIEGVAWDKGETIWIVSEGTEKKHPNRLISYNLLDESKKEIPLPAEILPKLKKKHGLEGVTVIDGKVYLAFQRGWLGDPDDITRIGCYDPETKRWKFAVYPLAPGHFLSGLCPAPNGRMALLERDRPARESARHKKIFTVDLSDFGKPLEKTLAVDLIPVYNRKRIPVPSKLEGLAFDGKDFWVVNDNDGLDDSYGETALMRVELSK